MKVGIFEQQYLAANFGTHKGKQVVEVTVRLDEEYLKKIHELWTEVAPKRSRFGTFEPLTRCVAGRTLAISFAVFW